MSPFQWFILQRSVLTAGCHLSLLGILTEIPRFPDARTTRLSSPPMPSVSSQSLSSDTPQAEIGRSHISLELQSHVPRSYQIFLGIVCKGGSQWIWSFFTLEYPIVPWWNLSKYVSKPGGVSRNRKWIFFSIKSSRLRFPVKMCRTGATVKDLGSASASIKLRKLNWTIDCLDRLKKLTVNFPVSFHLLYKFWRIKHHSRVSKCGFATAQNVDSTDSSTIIIKLRTLKGSMSLLRCIRLVKACLYPSQWTVLNVLGATNWVFEWLDTPGLSLSDKMSSL